MIIFNSPSHELPYMVFLDLYQKSIEAKQKNIEAMSISSYSSDNKEVNARFVNLKFINDKEFIFFSNYNSPKSKEFHSHNQITCLIYWNSINTQIRIKAYIKKTTKEFNQTYFVQRNKMKNALSISSNQSFPIDSYEAVKKNYELSVEEGNLNICPEYWGGFSFIPYYFEFWEGHSSRINKRDVYNKNDNNWDHFVLQP